MPSTQRGGDHYAAARSFDAAATELGTRRFVLTDEHVAPIRSLDVLGLQVAEAAFG
jgi:hypothetical protein